MKLGCSSWSYHAAIRAGRIDQKEWLRRCASDLDVDGVELVDLHFPTTDPAYLRDLKKQCIDAGLTIAGLAVSNDFGPADRRADEIEKVRQWCDVAAYLGAPVVRVFAGWLPAQPVEAPSGRIVGALRRVFGTKPLDRRRLWSDVMFALRTVADYGAERGVAVALQNNRADGVVGSTHELAQAIHDVGSPWLRVCLDPADFGDTTGIDLAYPRTVQVHARMRDVADDGSESSMHWPEILRSLRLAQYRGFVLLDYDGVEEPERAAPRAARYLRRVLNVLERQQLLAAPESAGAAPEAPPAVEPAAVAERDEVHAAL